jgi:hypothetical protein
VFFVLNAFFALAILLHVIWALIMGITSKNPETRYRPVHDDRGSFMKSQNNVVTELDALGMTARGEKSRRLDLDDADDDIATLRTTNVSQMSMSARSISGRGSGSQLLPGQAIERHASPGYGIEKRAVSPAYGFERHASPPLPAHTIERHASPLGSAQSFRQANNSSPWKTGVGY